MSRKEENYSQIKKDSNTERLTSNLALLTSLEPKSDEKTGLTNGFTIAIMCLSLILNGALIVFIIVNHFNLWSRIR